MEGEFEAGWRAAELKAVARHPAALSHSIVGCLPHRDFTADALVGVYADVRVPVSRFYSDQPHRLTAGGTPGPFKRIRVGQRVGHFEDLIHHQNQPRL